MVTASKSEAAKKTKAALKKTAKTVRTRNINK